MNFQTFVEQMHPFIVNGIGTAIGLSVAAAIILVAFGIVRYFLMPRSSTMEKSFPPDVSITKILKWGVVMIISAILGKKVWDILGDPLAKNLRAIIDEKFTKKDEPAAPAAATPPAES